MNFVAGPTLGAQHAVVGLSLVGILILVTGRAVSPLLIAALAGATLLSTVRFAITPRPMSPRWMWLVLAFVSAWVLFALWYTLAVQGGETMVSSSGELIAVDIWAGLYVSAQTLTTVTFGDVVPRTPVIRSIAMLEMATTVGLVSVGIGSYFARLATPPTAPPIPPSPGADGPNLAAP